MRLSFLCNNHPEVSDSLRPRNIILIVKEFVKVIVCISHICYIIKKKKLIDRTKHVTSLQCVFDSEYLFSELQLSSRAAARYRFCWS